MPILKPAYKETNIKDLSNKTIKIAISGLIVNKDIERITIDDGTGAVNAVIQTELPVNTFVRVYGILLPYEKGFEIQGHVIQDLSNINQNLLKKVKSLL